MRDRARHQRAQRRRRGAGREIATLDAPLLLVDGATLAAGSPTPERIAVYGAGRDPPALASALLARGLPSSAPCAVVVEVARRDETIIACTLEDLAESVADVGRGALTLVVAGGLTER